ncbi:MAG: YraN family protein [Desulfovibrio sp.]|nr:YraN family protein [Desulfovibrio sp.]
MSPIPRHLILGRSGEDAAARHLRGLGMRILHRNWSKRGLELDIICQDRDTLVFAEVKTRSPGSRGVPGQALTASKQSKLARAAALFLSERDLWAMPCRFDLLSVTPTEGSFCVEHLKNAFTLDDIQGGGTMWQPF